MAAGERRVDKEAHRGAMSSVSLRLGSVCGYRRLRARAQGGELTEGL